MGDRKFSCTYINPEFDPTKAGHRCKPQNGQHDVRIMLPFSIKCDNCGEYMFAGTKANARKELCYTEFYLGEINVYRIYMHCKSCYAEITIKTDPKNADYIVEKGAKRFFEPWRDFYVANALEEKERMKGTFIQQTEAKTVDMKKDMDQLHELERLKALAQKYNSVNLESVPTEEKQQEQILTDEDKQRIEQFEAQKQQQQQKAIKKEFLSTVSSPQPTITNSFKSKKTNLFSNQTADDFGF